MKQKRKQEKLKAWEELNPQLLVLKMGKRGPQLKECK